MDSGGKDNRDIAGRNAVLDQAADQQVDDLRTAGRSRRIRNDN